MNNKHGMIVTGLLLPVLSVVIVDATIILNHVSTVYVPNGHDPLTFGYNVEACEQSAVDEQQPYVYAAGGNLLHVVDFSNPEAPEIVFYVEISENATDGGINDVEVCQDWVAVAYNSFVSPLEGRAIVFSRYNPDDQVIMDRLHDVVVGATPDSLKFTNNCDKILVAIEAELVNNGGTMVDPEGGVTIVEFDGGVPGQDEPEVTFVNFTSFNDRADDYIRMGVRKIYNGQGTNDIESTTFSQDLEPENIDLNADDSLAYVPLQENNAIAVLDVEAKEFLEIYPMGYRNYGDSNSNGDRLDASDQDDVARITTWGDGVFGVFGMYQSDGIKFVNFEGRDYLFTANEGDTKEYVDVGLDEDWSEAMRGRSLVEADMISPNVSAEFISLLSDDALLGRLEMSIVDGYDDNGQIYQFLAFGGRNIAAHRAADISLAYDSRDDIEQRVLASFPEVFNANAREEDDTPEQTFDTRSDNRGPEPESLDYGVVNNKTVIFVGVERPGLVAIYSLVTGTDLELQFESIYYSGGMGDSWYKLWAERRARDLEPEDVRFLSADRSPTGNNMLIVSGAVSGTIAFYEVLDTEEL